MNTNLENTMYKLYHDKYLDLLKVIMACNKYEIYPLLKAIDQTVHVYLDCNDMFYWACSDAEELTVEDLPLLEQCAEDVKNCIIRSDKQESADIYHEIYFIAKKRGIRVQNAALDGLPKHIIELMDTCGPFREIGILNPCEHPLYPEF